MGLPRRARGWDGRRALGMDGRRLLNNVRTSQLHLCSPSEPSLPCVSIDERWEGTRNALAGLFCASLGTMDTQRTTAPTRAFPPTGDLPALPPPRTHRLRHAALPSEHVCTENLTPFLKLLPCPARAGAAALLAPHRVFDADWHGLGVHVRWVAGRGVELTMSVQAVFDTARTSAEGTRGAWAGLEG